MEEKKERLIKAIELAFLTASFNGHNVCKYRSDDDTSYAPDYYDERRYQFEVRINNDKNVKLYIRQAGFSVSIRTRNQKFGGWDEIRFEIKDILTNDDLYENVMKWLEEPLNRYRFKAEDIISKKAYNLKPENSNISSQIESFIYKLAFALEKGIAGKTYVHESYGSRRIKPVNFYYRPGNWSCLKKINLNVYYDGKFEKTFENYLLPGGTETHECNLNEILKVVDLNVIANIKLEILPNIEESPLLLQFIRLKLPEYFAKFTKGLNQKATVQDVAEVIKFRLNHDYCVCNDENFVYDPENNFSEDVRQEIAKIDENLEDRGTVFEKYKSTNAKKR